MRRCICYVKAVFCGLATWYFPSLAGRGCPGQLKNGRSDLCCAVCAVQCIYMILYECYDFKMMYILHVMQLCRACDALLLYSSGARETSEYMHHIHCNHRGLKFLSWPVLCEAQSCVSTMSSLGPLLSPSIALNRFRSLASALDS